MYKYILFFQKISGIGYKAILKMIEFFGSLENVFMASEDQLREFDLNDKIIYSIFENKKKFDFDFEMQRYEKNNIKMISIFEEHYPNRLRNISSPPVILFYKGNLFDFEKSIGVVGARKCTEYGVSVAKDFCEYFISKNIISISGGALGIDSVAHSTYVSKKEKTIAVMGCGLDVIYPNSNKNLFEEIIENDGSIVSEFPIGVGPIAKNFIMRNRIISGLSDCVLIVEAGLNSGTMTTAGFAIEQNKNVFVVPGSIYSPYSQGANKLIKDGAIFVTDPVEIEEMVFFEGEKVRRCEGESVGTKYFASIKNVKKEILKKEFDVSWMSDEQKRIFDSILYKPKNIENISLNLRLQISVVSPVLVLFEIKGLVKNIGGMNYVRN